jgi:hypothetical protein
MYRSFTCILSCRIQAVDFYCIKVKTVKKYSFFQIVATAIVARDEKTEKCKHQRPNVADTARLAASGS